MRALRDIPNQDGYRLIGITLDGAKLPCVVCVDSNGHHSVYRESDREHFWFKLYGWEPRSESVNSGSSQ